MKKMDEMDRSIQLRSEELGYRVVTLALCAWALCNSWQTIRNGAAYEPWPVLILCTGTLAQSFFQMALKQNMIAGDEEYREPNRLLRTALLCVVIFAIVLSAGAYLMAQA